MAKKLGKSYHMVNPYAQNKRQPNLETLFEISKTLKVEVKT
ncbi:Helix-turn-helix domain protein [Croceitalea dokdonensis DOKDO 023]|uniref:Helix-turn-helix domain protein n=1 Tax=Croceitalea dokdonensis DOKDO 023 TaxID=1300341 RepID=A0A0P7AUI0_9FLAO|nr:helix-turn-helix domain-containing protein [Croceitalea dokdonensis]KPM31477.1 Helix-turn-helix domain protein [Croceitalea dokdonensis DOKDO 023]